jgi:hypothetical protein
MSWANVKYIPNLTCANTESRQCSENKAHLKELKLFRQNYAKEISTIHVILGNYIK